MQRATFTANSGRRDIVVGSPQSVTASGFTRDNGCMSGKSELHSDAWSRFEQAVDVVAKSPPQHRTAESKQANKRRKKAPKRRVSSSKP
jgi:hypothetical protein